MDKETQVLEMAKILCPKGTANCEKCSKNYKCDVKFSQLAELFDGGCRIVSDDEIVIKESEYIDMELFENVIRARNDYYLKYEQAEKETAREILQEIQQMDGFSCDYDIDDIVLKIAEKYGIELED